MFVTKSARNQEHPQAFNVMFYTPEYFNKQNVGKQVKHYLGETILISMSQTDTISIKEIFDEN
jgi:hypothetical protein